MADIQREIYNNARNNSIKNPNSPNQEPVQRRRTKTEVSIINLLDIIKSETNMKYNSQNNWEDYESEAERIFEDLNRRLQKTKKDNKKRVTKSFIKGAIAALVVCGTISLGTHISNIPKISAAEKNISQEMSQVISNNTHRTSDYEHYWIDSVNVGSYISKQDNEAQYLYYMIKSLSSDWEIDERNSIIRSITGYEDLEQLLAGTGCKDLDEYREKAFALSEDVEVYVVEVRALNNIKYELGYNYSVDKVVEYINEYDNPYIAIYAMLQQMPEEHQQDIPEILRQTVNCNSEQELYLQVGCKNREEFHTIVRALSSTIENQNKYAQLMTESETEVQETMTNGR